jgi:hypothetical protein
MPNAKPQEFLVAKKKKGLKDWFGSENWVDIGAPKEGGGFEKCGRKSAKDSKRAYPKCVPAAKAARMSDKQIASAVRRKRTKKQGVGGKPTNVKTFASEGGIIMPGHTQAKMMKKGGKMAMKGGGTVGTKMMKKGGKMYAKGGGGVNAKMMKKGGKMAVRNGARKDTGGVKKNFRPPSSRNRGLYG